MPNQSSDYPFSFEAPQNSAQTSRYPVLFMHGTGIFSQLLSGAGFEPLARQLTSEGFCAIAKRVPPYQPIEARARIWKQHIDNMLVNHRVDRINLIAFSAGGLDARFCVKHLLGPEKVAAMITVSAPHHGSYLAEFFGRLDKRSRHLVSGRLNRLSRRYFPDKHADAWKALTELAPDHMQRTFNVEVADVPDVCYMSIGAVAGIGQKQPVSAFLMPGNRILYRSEGPNDGFVSATSARWGTSLGVIDADHAQLFGIPIARKSFDRMGFFRSLCQVLAQKGY